MGPGWPPSASSTEMPAKAPLARVVLAVGSWQSWESWWLSLEGAQTEELSEDIAWEAWGALWLGKLEQCAQTEPGDARPPTRLVLARASRSTAATLSRQPALLHPHPAPHLLAWCHLWEGDLQPHRPLGTSGSWLQVAGAHLWGPCRCSPQTRIPSSFQLGCSTHSLGRGSSLPVS